MSPAKATRPGFRRSISVAVDPRRADQAAINLFHPVYHAYTYPIGCRTDIDRTLPVNLIDMDTEEMIDNFSEPPCWLERFSPAAVQIGEQVIRGKNVSEMMLKVYRVMFDLFHGIGRFIETSATQNSGSPAHFPFMSLTIDPDTFHRIIESDCESGETTYSTVMKLFSQGLVSPCPTIPFHVLLPKLSNAAEIRLCIRASFIFYQRIIRSYMEFLRKHGEDQLLVLPYWLPDGGYSHMVVEILQQEFNAFCKKEKLDAGHLVLMLDNHQTDSAENDLLMKSWNRLEIEPSQNGKASSKNKSDTSKKTDHNSVTVLFRDRSFSDWVIHSNPSVKKLLDRTIAKVDSDINAQNVHYGWAHFEELEAVAYHPRSIVNFHQKMVKLTELGYLPLSPDFYVRGKLRGEFGCTPQEPLSVKVTDDSVGNGWNLEDCSDLSRWTGIHSQTAHPKEPDTPVREEIIERAYTRLCAENTQERRAGNGCWKAAWNLVLKKCNSAIIGNLETLEGGMAEILAKMTGQTTFEKQRRNVHDFLAAYTYIYWRDYFVQYDFSEADINILELTQKYLRVGVKGPFGETDAACAGTAAQAIFFALEAMRSLGAAWENMDQRAFYQNVVMLTLGMCNSIYTYHWCEDTKNAQNFLAMIKTELIDFENAYDRYKLASIGVSREQWLDAIRSEIDDSPDNIVKRASLRIAARHLRPLYQKEFTRQDAHTTTNVGHLWSIESVRENFRYENPLFCGMSES